MQFKYFLAIVHSIINNIYHSPLLKLRYKVGVKYRYEIKTSICLPTSSGNGVKVNVICFIFFGSRYKSPSSETSKLLEPGTFTTHNEL